METVAQASVPNALITAILDALPLSRDERLALVERSGLSPEAILDVNGRTPLLAFLPLWQAVLRVTGDEFVGLYIGRTIPGSRFGLTPHVAQNSRDFREMLLRLVRYAPLINHLIVCGLDEAPLLMHPAANVEQVGFALGYAEPTAFIRAFKKWYGTTPGEYRRRKG